MPVKFTVGDAPKPNFTIGDAPPPDDTTSTSPPTPPSALQELGDWAKNTAAPALAHVASGIGGGAIGLLNTGSEWAQKHLPAPVTSSWFGFGKPVDEEKFREKYVAPHNTGEQIGNTLEKAAEFAIPGAAEESAVGALPRVFQPAGRVAASALSSGAVNKAQGGEFGQGALLGGIGGAVGEGLRKAAPMLTEFAQGIHTPGFKTGRAILDETRGLMPGTIRRSAQNALDVLNPEMESVVGKATSPVSLLPARKVAAEQETRAFERNEPKMYRGVKRLGRIVTHDLSGGELPPEVPATKALELRRGVDTALPRGSFHPESSNAFKGYRTPLRNALNESIGEVVPEYRPIARRISNLIPATEPAAKGFGHLWGPGAGAIFGGYYGARGGARNEGGITGALKGGTLGALEGATAGTMLPAGINAAARSSEVLPRIFTGVAAQSLPRKKEK